MFYKTINEKLKNEDLRKLLMKLGYNTSFKALKAINKFMEFQSIEQWLNSHHYDLVYAPTDFLINICEVINIDKKLVIKKIERIESYNKEVERFKNSYIFVETNFKRKNESTIALAGLQKFRKITLYKDERLLFKSDNEILDIILKDIKKHFEKNNGELELWGKIDKYNLYLFDRVYVYKFKIKKEKLC